jgi:hypothetical protein
MSHPGVSCFGVPVYEAVAVYHAAFGYESC